MSRPLRIVSNRLPVSMQEQADGSWEIRPSSGGLVTALRPVLKQFGGAWVGWPGDAGDAPVDDLLNQLAEEMGCELKGLPLAPELVEGFYYGFSNETLWPLFHDLLGHALFEEEKWLTYVEANQIFADAIAEGVKPEEIVWVHDYQLMLVGEKARQAGVTNPLAFFLHIPFPGPDLFARLPWRMQLLRALLSFDLIGFQHPRDLNNFAVCLRTFIPEAAVFAGQTTMEITFESRVIKAGSFPISIDFNEFDRNTREKEVQDAAWFIHESYPDRQIILGVDRLDYTKGIPVKFRAYERALEKYPEMHEKVTFIQIVVPSRADVPEYARWKDKLDTIVGNVNGRFSRAGWMPLHYMYRHLSPTELLGFYRASEIALITPLKDGMNLVAKEFIASSVDENGVLILSEFAGAAAQLEKGALIVNPHDREGVADAIFRAFTMQGEQRRERMSLMREEVRQNDVFRWVNTFLEEVARAASISAAS